MSLRFKNNHQIFVIIFCMYIKEYQLEKKAPNTLSHSNQDFTLL